MKRMSQILYSFSLIILLILSSCGKDTSKIKALETSSLSGECACNSIEMPVCGINQNGDAVNYPNMCMADCFGAKNTVQGHCTCSQSLVCLSDGRTLSECDAQSAIRYDRSLLITKFQSCNSTAPASL